MAGKWSPTPPAPVEPNNEDPPNNNIVNFEILQTMRDLQEEIMNFKTKHERVLKTQEGLNEAMLYKVNEITNDKIKKKHKQENSSSGCPFFTESLYLVNQNIRAITPRIDIGRK